MIKRNTSAPSLVFVSAACILFTAAVLLCAPQPVCAQQGKSARSKCLVGVRLIEARRDPRGAPPKEIRMHSFLGDMSDQLVSLPFSDYRAIDTAEQRVSFHKRHSFQLNGRKKEQHVVTVVPHRMVGRHVHTTVDWRAPSGEGLVATKMRIDNGKNVVLGTDDSRTQSTIVSVKIDCLR